MTKKLSKEKLKYLSDLEKSATPADWVPMDLGQALKSAKDIPLLIELRNNASALIDEAKHAQYVEEFYEVRYEKLKELCEKNNLSTEFFNIMANGKESSTAMPHHSEIRSLKYDLEKLANKYNFMSDRLELYREIIGAMFNSKCNSGFSFRDIISVNYVDNCWEVEYESYFNPHANPKQLKDIKNFDNASEMITFVLDFIKKRI